MKRLARLALCLAFVPVSAAFARTEHNSFLETPANSTPALIAEVEHNSLVRERYERQFKMSEPTLIHYFSGLHVEPLKEDRRYLVFNVDDSLAIRSRMLHLTKGTLVFADSNHTPVLKCSCGNPMIASLPALGENDSSVHTVMLEGVTPFTRSAESPGDNEPLLADDNITMTGEEPGIDETPETGIPDSRPEPIVPTPTPIPFVPGAPPISPWLPLIPLIPIIPLIPLIPNPPASPPGTPLATPEPATFAPLAIGILALSRRRRKN